MTTEREFQEWRYKFRNRRKGKTTSQPVNKSVTSFQSGLMIIIFLTVMSGLVALKIQTNNQESLPNRKQNDLEYLNPSNI